MIFKLLFSGTVVGCFLISIALILEGVFELKDNKIVDFLFKIGVIVSLSFSTIVFLGLTCYLL